MFLLQGEEFEKRVQEVVQEAVAAVKVRTLSHAHLEVVWGRLHCAVWGA